MGTLIGEVVRADMIGDIDGNQQVVASYQFKNVGGASVSAAVTLSDLIEILEDLWVIVSQLHNLRVTYRRIRAQNMSTLETFGDENFDPVLVGDSAGDMMIPQATAVLSFITSVARVIPKKMYGPDSETSSGPGGGMSATTEALMVLAGAFLLEVQVATGTSWLYGYLSPKTLSFVEPTAATFITAFGSRRSRKIGVGI